MADNDHNTRWPSPSVTSVPEYQLSGLPFCHTKENVNGNESFTFPRVTRWISVSSTVAVKIFFAEDPDNAGLPHDNKFFLVPANTASRLELRCAKLYVRTEAQGNVSVIAGLTHISSNNSVPEAMLDWTLV